MEASIILSSDMATHKVSTRAEQGWVYIRVLPVALVSVWSFTATTDLFPDPRKQLLIQTENMNYTTRKLSLKLMYTYLDRYYIYLRTKY